MRSKELILAILFITLKSTLVSGDDITVIAPNGGGILAAGASTAITWITNKDIERVMIELTTDNEENWDTIADDTQNTGSYTWTVPNLSSDSCKIRVSDTTSGGPSDMSDSLFTIIQIRQLTVTAPNGGESLPVGSKLTITWKTYGLVDSVRIEFSSDNGDSWMVFTTRTPNTGSFLFPVPDVVKNSCKVKVSLASDTTVSDVSDDAFSIYNPNIEIVHHAGIPQGSALLTLGPNPVATTLSINFSCAKREKVLAEIYSLNGQLIERLADETKDAGFYTLLWDRTNNARQNIATGTHILRMRIGEKVFHKTLTIIK